MPVIVGVGYKKDRGKDKLCDFIQNHIRMEAPEYKVRKIGFADKVKDVAYQLYSWAGLKPGIYYDERRDLKETKIEALNRSPREIYILVGNMMREIYPDTWVQYALHGVEADVVLIKDTGFKNEAQAIRSTPDSLLVRIDRDGPMATDSREVELDDWQDWDFVVDNSRTLRELNTAARHIAARVIERLQQGS